MAFDVVGINSLQLSVYFFTAELAFFFFAVLGVEILDLERLEIPIDDLFLLLFPIRPLAADLLLGVDPTFLIDFNFGVLAAFF